jgi:hypothetical protein
MQKDMKIAQYKQCDGWKKIEKKVIPVITKSISSIREEKFKIEDMVFQQFLKKGGFWSFNTGEYNLENKNG